MFNASSGEIFGNTAGDTRADETWPIDPCSPYGAAKAAATLLVKSYRDVFGLFACSGFMFNHESPLRPQNFVAQRIVHGAIDIAQGRRERLTLGNLSIVRDWGWAPDFVGCMWAMLQQDKPRDFVVATGIGTSLEDFVDHVFRRFKLNWKERVDIDDSLMRPNEIARSVGNPAQAQAVLGWRAQVRMPELADRLDRCRACRGGLTPPITRGASVAAFQTASSVAPQSNMRPDDFDAERAIAAIESVVGDAPRPVPLHEPRFAGKEWDYVKETIDTGWVSSVGAYVDKFEKDLAEACEVPFAVATMNGTAALHACLLLAGVKHNDEVLLPALTFIATANAVSYCGAIPHLCDSDEKSLGIDVEKLDRYLVRDRGNLAGRLPQPAHRPPDRGDRADAHVRSSRRHGCSGGGRRTLAPADDRGRRRGAWHALQGPPRRLSRHDGGAELQRQQGGDDRRRRRAC